MKRISLLFLLLTLSPAASAFNPMVPPRIVNGITVSPESTAAKFTPRIVASSDNGIIKECTGVLVEKNLVLTAAHCLIDMSSVQVRFESSELPSFVTSATRFKAHPLYTWRPKVKKLPSSDRTAAYSQTDDVPHTDESGNIFFLKDAYEKNKQDYLEDFRLKEERSISFTGLEEERIHDIGVILLEETPPKGYQPIDLLDTFPTDVLVYGTALSAYGYGYHDLNIFSSDNQLRWTDLNFVGTVKHQNSPVYLVGFSLNRFGIISGDSGGPATLQVGGREYLIGLTGSIAHNGHALFVIPQAFKDWIRKTADELSGMSQLN